MEKNTKYLLLGLGGITILVVALTTMVLLNAKPAKAIGETCYLTQDGDMYCENPVAGTNNCQCRGCTSQQVNSGVCHNEGCKVEPIDGTCVKVEAGPGFGKCAANCEFYP